jgi:GNAT superfamily N-acetyltransferase
MEARDRARVVEIHLGSFPGFFLSILGPSFLSLLYESIRVDPEGIALVHENGIVDGFVAGVVDQQAFFRRMKRTRWWRFAWSAAGAVVRKPQILPRLVRTLQLPVASSKASEKACLLSIAVAKDAQSKGIGKQLVSSFCNEIAGQNISAFCLTTDRDQNEATNSFYLRLGFALSRVFATPEGRMMYEYVMMLPKEDGST